MSTAGTGPWIDCHNHLHSDCLGNPADLVAEMRSAGVGRCVVNATCEADWPVLDTLASSFPEVIIPAFGIHPWNAGECAGKPGFQSQSNKYAPAFLQPLIYMLEKHPAAGIGECGLDHTAKSPPMDAQWPVFLTHLRLARETDRPLTVHCVKAWGKLLDAFADEPPPAKFLLHSFSGSLEIARRLIPMGAYFSISGKALNPHASDLLDIFRQLPHARILLETDAPSGLPPAGFISHPLPGNHNHPANLPAIGAGIAAALGMNAAELAGLTTANAAACFNW